MQHTIQSTLQSFDRQISSSQDHCRCEGCRNQKQEHKTQDRQNLSSIYILRHAKKRGVPPTKNDFLVKGISGEGKFTIKRKQLEKKKQAERKNESEKGQKSGAVPQKLKLLETIRKQTGASSGVGVIQYHQVSHSQREKVPSKQPLESNNEFNRRIVNVDQARLEGFKKRGKVFAGSLKMVEISHNPENIKLRYQNSRSVSQASAGCQKHEKQNES